MKKKYIIILVLLLLIIVGYAILKKDIKVNGNIELTKSTWDVKFKTITEVKNDGTIISAPIVTDNTNLKFGIKLNNPGDEYIINVDVENNGSIDAMLSQNPTLIGLEDLNSILEYRISYKENVRIEEKDLLKSNSKDTIKIEIKFKKDVTEEDLKMLLSQDITKILNFSMVYVQADKTAKERNKHVITILDGEKGNLKLGDMIRIGRTEDFYVISSDNSQNGKTRLVSKYLLNVGIYKNNYLPEGLQHHQIRGNSYGFETYGTLEFSDTPYWMDNNELKSMYSDNGKIYYDSTSGNFKNREDNSKAYPYVYENGYIYQYIDGSGGYIDKLKDMGAPNTIVGGLLKYDDFISMSETDEGKKVLYNEKLSYWLGCVCSNRVFAYRIEPSKISCVSNNGKSDGVRPVIEIFTSDIEKE